jgi:hypothetical protein
MLFPHDHDVLVGAFSLDFLLFLIDLLSNLL